MMRSVRALLALVVVFALVFALGPIISAPAENRVFGTGHIEAGNPGFSIQASPAFVGDVGLALGIPAPLAGPVQSQSEQGFPFGITSIVTPASAIVSSDASTQVAAAISSVGVFRASTSLDRLSPSVLGGTTVKGSIYVFLDIASTNVTSVSFWLDDPNRVFNPIQKEGSAPYDLMGGSIATANPLITGSLKDGSHIVTAIVRYSNGSTAKVETGFTVNNGTSAPATTTTAVQSPTTTTTSAAPVTTTTSLSGSGGVLIRAGQSIQAAVDANPAGTVFRLEAGVYRNQTVRPKDRQQFIGQAGAVMTGGGSTKQAFEGTGADDVVIRGLVIENYSPGQDRGVMLSTNGSQRWRVEGNEIRNNVGAGVEAGTGWMIIGNYVHHNSQYGLTGSGGGILVEGNELAFNNPGGSANAGGTKFVQSNNLVIRNNYSHDNRGPGLWIDGRVEGTVIEGNRVIDNTHAGIKVELAGGTVVRNNYAERNGFGNSNWIEGAGIVVLNSSNVEVYNNTVIGNRNGIGGIHATRSCLPGCTFDYSIDLRNFYVHDNDIRMAEGVTGIATNTGDPVYSGWNNRFERNTYTLTGSAAYRWAGNNIMSAEQWRAAGNDIDGTWR